MENIVCGQYLLDEGGKSLRHIHTEQAIHQEADAIGRRMAFAYSDRDVTAPFLVEFLGGVVFVDFNRLCTPLTMSYGLWRRMAYFLLDSLVVWFFLAQEKCRDRFVRVELIGGWQNGVWNKALVLQAVIINPHGANLSAQPKEAVFPMCHLEREPMTWLYFDAENIEPEIILQVIRGEGEIPLLDMTTPFAAQISGGPRFVRDDGKAFLFHRYVRVNFHRGEDYEPMPFYGYANNDVAFTMQTSFSYGVDGFADPVLINPRSSSDAYFRDRGENGDKLKSMDLTLPMREELIFALIDIQAIINDMKSPGMSSLPMILEKDRENIECNVKRMPELRSRPLSGIMFGSHLEKIYGLSMDSPLGMTQTSFRPIYGRWKQRAKFVPPEIVTGVQPRNWRSASQLIQLE